MRKSANTLLTTVGALALVMGGLAITPTIVSAAEPTAVEKGRDVAFNRKKGNCLACHKIAGGNLPGNIGPELVNMGARYPNKAELRAQIWDATVVNPNTIMPPFGRHKIISEKELDMVVEFVHSL